ncbi:hypothetical protein F4824DRAFT_471099 [Ustulina deusta]|nr:hypothetical protein F4824DRAFT_471099 [Ustulina deusta]
MAFFFFIALRLSFLTTCFSKYSALPPNRPLGGQKQHSGLFRCRVYYVPWVALGCFAAALRCFAGVPLPCMYLLPVYRLSFFCLLYMRSLCCGLALRGVGYFRVTPPTAPPSVGFSVIERIAYMCLDRLVYYCFL